MQKAVGAQTELYANMEAKSRSHSHKIYHRDFWRMNESVCNIDFSVWMCIDIGTPHPTPHPSNYAGNHKNCITHTRD